MEFWEVERLDPERMLTPAEWRLLDATLAFLEIPKGVMIEGQKEDEPTLPWGVANYAYLFEMLERHVAPRPLQPYVLNLKDKCAHYWDGTGDVYFAAMVLDPREKLLGVANDFREKVRGVSKLPPEDIKARCLLEFHKVLRRLGPSRRETPSESSADRSPEVEEAVALLQATRQPPQPGRRVAKRLKLISPQQYRMARVALAADEEASDGTSDTPPRQSPLELEFDVYLAEGAVPFHINALEWWREHEPKIPTLARCARFFLSIPATSATCERLWSQAGQNFSKYRHRIELDRALSELVLRSWGFSGF
jgi:hypothetical protein